MASEAEEVAGLDRVLTRLALTQDENLHKVLQKLVPAVIGTLKSPHEKTRRKVLEILTHVNKRVKGVSDLQLPTLELLDLFVAPDSAPMVRNFALVYTEMAFERATAPTKLSVAGKILVRVAGRPAQHANICLRIAIAGLAGYSPPSGLSNEESAAHITNTFPFLSQPADLQRFLDHVLKVLLYQPLSTENKALNTPLAAAQARAQAAAPAPAGTAPTAVPDAPTAPAGLSIQDMKLIEEKGIPSHQVLAQRKLGLLNLLAAAEVDPKLLITPCLVSACDPNDAVARRGDELMKRRCAVDSNKPAVDLEEVSLIQSWMRLFHGTPDTETVAPEAKVTPASMAVKVRLLGLFCRSIAATCQGDLTLKTIAACTDESVTNLRLRQSGMEFTVWTLKHASLEQLRHMGPRVIEGLMDQLHKPSALDSVSLMMRSFAYQALGQLAQRVPALFSGNTDTAQFFFTALSYEPAGVRASVQEAVGSLSEAYKGLKGEQQEAVEKLLLQSILSNQDTVRLCSVQWAIKLFPLEHPPARYICVLAAGDNKIEIKEEAKRGLTPPSKDKSPGANTLTGTFPRLSVMLQYVVKQQARFRTQPDPLAKLVLQPRAFLALIQLLKTCKAEGAGQEAEGTYAEDCVGSLPLAYCRILEHGLIPDTTTELAVAALEGLLDLGAEGPDTFAARYAPRTSWLRGFLTHINAGVRTAAARLLGITAAALSSAEAEALLEEVSKVVGGTESKLNKEDEHEGCITATGLILAQCATGTPSVPPATVTATITKLVDALHNKSSVLSAAAALALSSVALRAELPLPATVEGAPSVTKSESRDKVWIAVQEGHNSRAAVVKRIVELFEDKEAKVVARAVTAAAYLATGEAVTDLVNPVLEGLFKLSFSKAEDVQFAVGEALSIIFGGVPVTNDMVLKSNFQNLSTQFDFYRQADGEIPVLPQTKGLGHSSGKEDARISAREQILTKILQEMVPHTRQEVRCAASVWLFSLLIYTNRHPRLMSILPDIQNAFSRLLGDTNELTQEMASRGVSAVYNLGDESTKQQLVANLVGVLSGTGKQAIKVTSDTKVFEAGQIGTTPGGESLTTYKELCSLATELGQPDLIYKFMDLAHHNAAINAKRGAAFGFASIAKLAGERLGPHMKHLIPKLYRYQYDPNPRVQDAMSHIWRALVDNPKVTVDENFDAIMADLLSEISGWLWRSRQAACAALADLIGGRRWAQIGEYLDRIWTMMLRAMDDIKESVRQAASALSRTVRGLTLRLVDVEHTPPSEVRQAVSVVVPLLLEKGVNSSVAEVRSMAVNLLAKICKVAGGSQLQAQIVPLTTCMLEALSSLEDARLNYVEQHAERMGLDADRLADLRVSASKSSPLGDTLDLAVRYTEPSTLESLVPALVGVIKRGVGLNTKVGAARFIKSLAMRLTSSDLQPHTATLFKTLFNAARSEKSNTIRRAYAGTLASLAKVATPKRVEKLVVDSVALYSDPGDSDSKYVSGLILRELLKGAPDIFQSHAAQILPLAFAAKTDDDSDVAGLWKDVWEDGVSSEAGAARLYAGELVEVVMEGLGSQQWGRRKSAAQALVKLVELSDSSIAPHAQRLATSLIAETSGRLWDGKEKILEAITALCKGCPAALADNPGHGKIVDVLLAACQRQKSSFRKVALASLSEALLGLKGDFYVKVAPVMIDACHRNSIQPESSSNGTKTEAGEEDTPVDKPAPLAESLQVLQAAWSTAGPETVKAHAEELSRCLAEVLEANHPWALRVEALKVVTEFAQKLPADESLLTGMKSTLGVLVSGTLAAAESASVQQLKKTSLTTLSELLKVSREGSLLDASVMQSVTQFLTEVSETDSSAAIRADALELRGRVSKNAPVPMSTS